MTELSFDGFSKMCGLGCFFLQLSFLLIPYSFNPLSKKFIFEFKEAYLLHTSERRELIKPSMQIYLLDSDVITHVVLKSHK